MGVGSQQLDRFLAWLASRQHGVVTRRQLLAAGVSRRVIERRVAAGGLIPIHPGVYLVGHRAVSPLAYEAAAILACQPGPLLSHATAGKLWRLPVPGGGPIHVTVVGRRRRSLKGVEVHSVEQVDAEDVARHEGLPLTSLRLTLLDLAGSISADDLEAALNEARIEYGLQNRALHAVLDQHPKRRGARALRSLLAAEGGPQITRSQAERRALRQMKAHGIVPDASDHPIGPFRADFWFERERVAVEVDGYRFHSTPERFVRDRRRIAYLAARGIQVFPLSWHDLGAREAMERLKATLERRVSGSE